MEVKWIAGTIIALFVCTFGSIAITEWQKNECKITALHVNKSAEEIQKICK